MLKRAIRVMGAIAITLTVAACDKCGDFNINMPKFEGTKSCTNQTPRG
ncbi:hypothetical protein [Microvirga pudoricolor]|nr:hypothetical protein [Microvirga pudoricolor]MBM6594516.1 hypothetical protein [Microvirga pudoricolor]